MDAPTIKQDEHFTVPEHEILLSFNSDNDAVAFYEWWNEKGWTEFEKWAKRNRKD